MRHLHVSGFSSISEASIDFSPLTVIIGPQASGKSVLCKLAYFFISLTQDQVRLVSEQQTLNEFKETIREKFIRWFPVSTWGTGKFDLSFKAGDYELSLKRTSYNSKVTENFSIKLSEPLQSEYESSLSRVSSSLQRKGAKTSVLEGAFPIWQLQEALRNDLLQLMGGDEVEGQMFIPAARSFFTSIGRAIAVFESSESMDPLTLEFGRLFASRLDRGPFLARIGQRRIDSYLQQITAELMQGELVREKNKNFLKSQDGRKIPIAIMSSGQQELLPLLQTLPAGHFDHRRVYYIEEPEAHLFPTAQARLIEVLTTVQNLHNGGLDLVLTTHSPYVLAKFNNLIKAGNISKSDAKERVSHLMKSDSLIKRGQLAAYAICDSRVVSITEDDGLINGDYLDDISRNISDEYSNLLEIEYGTQKKG